MISAQINEMALMKQTVMDLEMQQSKVKDRYVNFPNTRLARRFVILVQGYAIIVSVVESYKSDSSLNIYTIYGR